jgi:DNA (cytosine-5)-methyltransferase 1
MKGFDLFSGMGGFHHAAHDLLGKEYETVAYCEIDPKARIAYEATLNHSFPKAFSDVNDITGDLNPSLPHFANKVQINSVLPNFDILFAGFPCQPFSSMGLRNGMDDPRGILFNHIEAILAVKKPRYFILENVRGIKTINGGDVMRHIISTLQSIGYQTTTWMLNSADYGVPQTRRRIFFVGDLKGHNKNLDENMPPKKILASARRHKNVLDILEKDVDEKYFLSEKIKKTILSSGTGGYNYKAEINMDPARPLTYTMHKMHRASQDNYYNLKYINNGSAKKMRRITPYEAILLQGFKKNTAKKICSLGMSDTQIYKLAGNAVTASTAKAVLQHLMLGSK